MCGVSENRQERLGLNASEKIDQLLKFVGFMEREGGLKEILYDYSASLCSLMNFQCWHTLFSHAVVQLHTFLFDALL